MALIAADIAYWPATPRMKSMRPTIAERLDNPDLTLLSSLSTYKSFDSCKAITISEIKINISLFPALLSSNVKCNP